MVELEAARQELAQTNIELSTVKQRLATTKTELDTVRQEIDITKQELNNVRQEIDITKQELDTVRQERNNAITNLLKLQHSPAMPEYEPMTAAMPEAVTVETATETMPTVEQTVGLNQQQLAQRLGVNGGTVSRHRHKTTKAEFEKWSRKLDPDAHGWRFDDESGLFFKLEN